MTKQFAMMQAARQLEGYLIQERYSLDRMNTNQNVTEDFLRVKVERFNGLVTTLNHLFSALSGTASPLFEGYSLDGDDFDSSFVVQLPSYVSDTIALPESPAATISAAMGILGAQQVTAMEPPVHTYESPVADDTESEDPQATADDVPDAEPVPIWESDGYTSHDEWLVDKQRESLEIRDDVSVTVDVGVSQQRVEQMLTEYSETTEQNIDTYVPEDDVPVSVFESDEPDEEMERSTRDLRYLNHAADDTRLDTDPTQITQVETAVEREGENGSKGTDIDIASYTYQSDESFVNDLITDDINRLLKQPVPEHAADD